MKKTPIKSDQPGVLVDTARVIGSALGTLAATAGEAKKTIEATVLDTVAKVKSAAAAGLTPSVPRRPKRSLRKRPKSRRPKSHSKTRRATPKRKSRR